MIITEQLLKSLQCHRLKRACRCKSLESSKEHPGFKCLIVDSKTSTSRLQFNSSIYNSNHKIVFWSTEYLHWYLGLSFFDTISTIHEKQYLTKISTSLNFSQ